MPQFRKLHTKIVDSFDVNDMPDYLHMLLWSWLPLIVCKEGRGIYKFSWIKSKVFPLRDDITTKKIEKCMEYFKKHGMIYIYSVNNREYFGINSWHEHQNTARDATSPYPEPTEDEIPTPEQVASKSSLDKNKIKNKNREEVEEIIDTGDNIYSRFSKVTGLLFSGKDDGDRFDLAIQDFGEKRVFEIGEWCASKKFSSMKAVLTTIDNKAPGWNQRPETNQEMLKRIAEEDDDEEIPL